MRIAPWNDPELRWVCEAHPTKDFEHRLFFGLGRECAGPGMPEPHDAKGHRCTVGCDKYYSGHSIGADGHCNMGCC